MKYPLMFLLFSSLALSGANLLPDGGFELGGRDWTFHRFGDVRKPETLKYLPPVIDSNEKIEGAQSLRFENPHSQFTGIRTPEVKLENDAYTFSFYAKADRPVRIRIMVLSIEDITGEKRKLSWDNRSVRYFQLNKEWTRYQFQHKKRDPRFQHYLVDFSWGNGNDATVWLDAMQFERGSEMTPYTAYASVESVLYGTKYNRIEGEPPLTYTIEALNRSKEPVRKQYFLTEKNDTTGEVVKQHRFVLEIPPGGKAERSFQTEGGKFGIYSVSGSGVMPFLYGYSPRYVRQAVDPQKDFLFGVEFEDNYSYPDLNGGKSYLRLLQADHAEYLKMAENQGHRMIRIGNGSGAWFLVWKNLEPEEGKFDFQQSDRIIRQTADAGNAILGVLGNLLMMKSYPEWLVKKSKLGDLKWRVGKSPAGYPPIQDFRRYVRTLAERYKREIRFWEVFNEPNLNIPGDAFVPYQKAAYEEIKKIDPGIQVVGPNVTGDLGGEMADFLDAFGRAGGFAYTDILSFHPYSSREEYSPYPADQAIRDIRKILKKYHAEHLPLWNTELYYIKQLHPHYAKQSEFESWRFLRRLLIDLGEGVKVVTLLPESRSLRKDRHFNYQYAERRVLRTLTPSSDYVVGCAFAKRFEGAVPLRRIRPLEGITVYLYRGKDGKGLGAFWKYQKNQNAVLRTPEKSSLRFYDIFGNVLHASNELRITEAPLIIETDSVEILESEFRKLKFIPDIPFLVTGGRWFADQDGISIAAGLCNLTDQTLLLRGRVSAPEAGKAAKPGSREIFLKPKETRTVLFPIILKNADAAPKTEAVLLLFDGKKVHKYKLSLPHTGFTKFGQKTTYGKTEFTVSRKKETVVFNLFVRDATIGPRMRNPWEEDCIEFFFDRNPLTDLDRDRHTADCFRLFIRPAAADAPPRIDALGKIDLKSVKWNVARESEGYRVNLELPLKTPFSFDLSTDDGTPKRIQHNWSGGEFNYLFRNAFGMAR